MFAFRSLVWRFAGIIFARLFCGKSAFNSKEVSSEWRKAETHCRAGKAE